MSTSAPKRRIPKKGVVRYWTETSFGGLRVMRGVVIRTSLTNRPLIRTYTSKLFAPPKLEKKPHVLLAIDGDTHYRHWVQNDRLLLRRKDAEQIVEDAMRLHAHAQRTAQVDSVW